MPELDHGPRDDRGHLKAGPRRRGEATGCSPRGQGQLDRGDPAAYDAVPTADQFVFRRGRIADIAGAPSLLSWLEVEMHALDSIICDSILHYSLGTRWTPRYIYGLSKGDVGSKLLQEFIADKHHPAASNAAQSLLAALTNLPSPPDNIYPAPLTCAYILKAALTAVEVHASAFKLWQSPPAREPVWTALLRSVQDMAERMKGGSTVPMTVSVMNTIRDTISKWKGELSQPSNLVDPTWVSLGGPSVCPVLQSLEELMSTIDWDHLVM